MCLIVDIGQYMTPAQPVSPGIETRAWERRCDGGGDGEDSLVLTLGRATVKMLELCSSVPHRRMAGIISSRSFLE